jgi:hypothetical protein
MRLRATFTTVLHDRLIVLYDHSAKTSGASIAADARFVVASCLQAHGSRRIIFRDARGTWRNLLHDGEGFLATSRIPADELESIAARCRIVL